MRDDKIRAAELPIEGRRSQHDACETSNQKLKEKSDTEQHRGLELNPAAPHGAKPIEDLDSCRDAHGKRGDCKKTVCVRVHSDGEHVVRPHTQAYESNAGCSAHHNRVSKNRFSGKYWNNFRQKRKGGNHQDVDLWMTKNPEEVHP